MSVFEHYFYGPQFDMLCAGGSTDNDLTLGGILAFNVVGLSQWTVWNFGSVFQ